MTPRQVVLTGATGFIGSRVAALLLRDPGAWRVRVVARRAPEALIAAGAEWCEADLAAPDTLRGVCEGADALLHLAARVGGDPDQCAAVNEHGTTRLMAEAARGGVRRVTQLSTAAVYGRGPHRGPDVGEVEPAPVSAASATRLAGERAALAAGAVVLRPGLVLGAGDRWVVPALAELRRQVPARWDAGTARLSLVAVEDLARLITATLDTPGLTGPSVHHASHPRPVRSGDLLDALTGHGVLPEVPGRDWSWSRCLEELAAANTWVSPRQFELLAQDNWFRSERVWRLAGVSCGPDPLERVAAWAPWYREHCRSDTTL
ncbi:NAD(P)-dependent oxidoreductase [Streptomyces sp. NL15-2K]|uniref:NAD-dependent epimerase/dehydratase family protein n=1 Tax=Streptomyces sp. NL15-2K TaxID=376149 RepID=UPI000F55B116|nr:MULTISPECIES: NAD-dependent epimerase/dehydratase family protein [Actinomycetes]WKX07867.1 NAD-dependent epimerase/dehydratase family protein [Kutzneria buriramensis]GCB50692.1 UDP-glucose 4-epimerase [Streptomyces sp. NL15-2K]